MKNFESDFHFEEKFDQQDRKEARRERKIASSKDRSKLKKSDQDQLKKKLADLPPVELDANENRGRVLAITPEGILVDCDGRLYTCALRGALKQDRHRFKNLVAVGDFVHFLPQGEDEGSISWIEERKSILSRADNLSRNKEQLIAVNIDQVLITASVVLPSLKLPLIDRYIIAAKKGNMDAVIVINKIDLLNSSQTMFDKDLIAAEKENYSDFIETYKKLNIPIYPVSASTGEGIDALKKTMQGKSSVFSGQSGVGKSSLINAVMGTELKVGEMVGKTRKGSHTTTTSHLVPVQGGGFCIDTPGIKSFGLWDLTKTEIQSYFSEIYEVAKDCKYPDCHHLQEPDCAVKAAVEEKVISPLRFASYCALMTGLKTEHKHR